MQCDDTHWKYCCNSIYWCKAGQSKVLAIKLLEREREREPVESQSSSRGSKKKNIEKRKAIPVVVEIGDL